MAIEHLSKQHERGGFDCEETSLNEYLINYARQNDDRGLGRTFVLVEPPSVSVMGFYTISSGSVQFDVIPMNLPKYPIPVVHLGRLAVDKTQKGKGFGELLLMDALARAERTATQIGAFAVEVKALHEGAKNFYLKYGFEPLRDDPLHLYLAMKKIKQLNLNG